MEFRFCRLFFTKGINMAKNVGIWIDHRKALIVFSSKSSEELKRIDSNVEQLKSPASGSRSSTPHGPQDVAAGDSQDRKHATHLNNYYQEVIECLRDAESILVFGPGEAKGEFQKQFKDKQLRNRIVAVETVDKMTDNQVIAKVRDYFHPKTGK